MESSQTICQLDTPLNNPSENILSEIEVIDPAHPLYGRRFPLISLSHPPRGSHKALVAYQKDILIRIPLGATSLCAQLPNLAKTKLSFDAVSELIELASQLGISPNKGGAI